MSTSIISHYRVGKHKFRSYNTLLEFFKEYPEYYYAKAYDWTGKFVKYVYK